MRSSEACTVSVDDGLQGPGQQQDAVAWLLIPGLHGMGSPVRFED